MRSSSLERQAEQTDYYSAHSMLINDELEDALIKQAAEFTQRSVIGVANG